MTKVGQRFRGGIKRLAEKAFDRVPKYGSNIYALKINDGEKEVAAGRVIDNINHTGFATILSQTVESIVPHDEGEAVLINGDIIISLVDEEIPVVDRVFLNKDDAVFEWEKFTTERREIARKYKEAYTGLEGMFEGILKKGAF